MAFPRIEIYPRARPLTGDEDMVVSQGGVLRKASTDQIKTFVNTGGGGGDGTTTFNGTASALAVGTAVGIGPSGALVECKASDGAAMPSFIGFLLDPAINKVQTETIYATSGLSAGSSYFIAASGGVTTTPPSTAGYAVPRIGAAFSTTKLFLQPGIIVLNGD